MVGCIKLEARVNSAPKFEGGFFKIPIDVKDVTILNTSSILEHIGEEQVRRHLKSSKTIWYDGQVLPISPGDEINVYRADVGIMGKEPFAYRIELLNSSGTIIGDYSSARIEDYELKDKTLVMAGND